MEHVHAYTRGAWLILAMAGLHLAGCASHVPRTALPVEPPAHSSVIKPLLPADGTPAGAPAQGGRGNVDADPSAAAAVPRKDILPFLDFSLPQATPGSAAFLDTYTRIYVEGENPQTVQAAGAGELQCRSAPGSRCYQDEHRPLLARVAMDREFSRLISVRIELQNPDASTTTTLASSSYRSGGSKGETWETEAHGRLFLTPLFRIDSNTVLRAEAHLNATSSRKDQVSGPALAVLQNAARLMAPTTTLLTPLTAEDANTASRFFSQTLSELFSNSLSEKSSVDIGASRLGDQPIAQLTAYFPEGRHVYDRRLALIGTWNLMSSPPVISVFSDVTATCTPAPGCLAAQARMALAGVPAARILTFRVAPRVSIRDALAADASVGDAVLALRDAKAGQALRDAARAACQRVDEKAHQLGLNRFDAAAVLWAYSHEATLGSAQGLALRQAGCPAAVIAADIWGAAR